MPDCRAETQDRPAGVEWESTVFRKVEEAAKGDRGLTVERMMELGRVSRSSFYRFDAKDYRDRHQNKCKTMTVTADEFIRRFMQHALPPGFQRIRQMA